ncbi:MAG TPA: LamG domain-containing protein [Bacteroidales bacterium]|nr:LamG domain-containing protein [Bacteroidales bacterium]HPF02705.1 LamG domain-containing protein [Bacteroidales bacterium]HPJ58535.1 LamG domain-containing protein [Bacteroidales bacterium]HPR11710.1 LamG domain-containing protein [Bacteroidales bacterium]HRW86460.1 LamG domain-containing protein [Bacteroidales bacterium]
MIQNNEPQMTKVMAEWYLASLTEKMEPAVKIKGKPAITASRYGKAVSFNGATDVIFLEENPLKDLGSFTIEAIFMPASGGNFEQRFLHIGETQGDRVLLELRATETHWYFDAFITVGDEKCTLIDPERLHPMDEWYHVAYVIDNGKLETWVNGKKELEGSIVMAPVKGGKTSFGARQNEVSWFRGTIYKVKITAEALTPDKFINH